MLAADVKSGDPEKLAETLDGVTRQTLLVRSHFCIRNHCVSQVVLSARCDCRGLVYTKRGGFARI